MPRSIAYACVIFFIFSSGVCAQYLVWLTPFVLFLSPTFFGWLTATSSLFFFFFYSGIADKFPWYLGISHGGHNPEWTAWLWGVNYGPARSLDQCETQKFFAPSLEFRTIRP